MTLECYRRRHCSREHRHSPSCRKSDQGNQKCRMDFPNYKFSETTVTESGEEKMDVLLVMSLYFTKDSR